MTDEVEMRGIFEETYGAKGGVVVASAPGRVNIIGEHTDYNEGFVLPTPIGSRVWVAGMRRTDSEYRLIAHDLGQKHVFMLGKQAFSELIRWANFVMGVVDAMQRKGYRLGGTDLVIKGDVPQAAGLSSSAALEVATLRTLVDLFDLEIDPVELAYLGKAAENDFVGVQSGIMDQFCASLGKPGHALLIDCRSNGYRQVDIPSGCSLVAVNSGVKRKLDSSAYNERVGQCMEGVKVVQRRHPEIRSLRDVDLLWLEGSRGELSEVVYRRCRHVITENGRTLSAVKAMDSNDAVKLGELMSESHRSLREDYEVSCPELDDLVDLAMGTGYVFGARLTGAGFGGCTINLLPNYNVPDFAEFMLMEYRKKTGLKAEVYSV